MVEIVDCKHGGPLVLVGEEAEALGLASDLVADEVHVDNFAELREHDANVAFVHAVVEVGDKDVAAALVVVMPRSRLLAAEFLLGELFDGSGGVHNKNNNSDDTEGTNLLFARR